MFNNGTNNSPFQSTLLITKITPEPVILSVVTQRGAIQVYLKMMHSNNSRKICSALHLEPHSGTTLVARLAIITPTHRCSVPAPWPIIIPQATACSAQATQATQAIPCLTPTPTTTPVTMLPCSTLATTPTRVTRAVPCSASALVPITTLPCSTLELLTLRQILAWIETTKGLWDPPIHSMSTIPSLSRTPLPTSKYLWSNALTEFPPATWSQSDLTAGTYSGKNHSTKSPWKIKFSESWWGNSSFI